MSNTVVVLVQYEAGVKAPQYAHSGDAGADLCAKEATYILPYTPTLVKTGIRIAVPEGYVAQICPRSGLALKYGITVLNAPGIVDSTYRGEVGVVLINHGTEPYRVERGERVAQMVLTEVKRIEWRTVSELPASDRGEGGFGSTGH